MFNTLLPYYLTTLPYYLTTFITPQWYPKTTIRETIVDVWPLLVLGTIILLFHSFPSLLQSLETH